VTDYRTGAGWVCVTSDATDAYQLVNPDVARVQRTLVFFKPDIVVFLDRVVLTKNPATVQVRFQVNHEDYAANVSANGDTFRIERPHASLLARVAPATGRAVRVDRLKLEEKDGIYPFVEIADAPAFDHEIITVCSARPTGFTHGSLVIERTAGLWRVSGAHAGQKVQITLTADSVGAPVITV
ncbi:MAG: hypothetical protein WCQ44_08400, partial [Opitutaceae bacterium]